jgi:hypothetical protein
MTEPFLFIKTSQLHGLKSVGQHLLFSARERGGHLEAAGVHRHRFGGHRG